MRLINSFILFSICISTNLFSQNLESLSLLSSVRKIDIPKVKSQKSGPYIGYQRGKYDLIEFGAEMQFKKIKLKNPIVNGYRFGTNYAIKENVLGFDLCYWRQEARLGLTYGAILSHRTNFEVSRIGIAPVIGFRFLQFHLQTGYTFYSSAHNFDNINRYFIALKFTIINNRDIDIKK
ncbi:MAG: hypothetical protein ACK5B9_05700 [Flavobacteriia bacterium]|jgi:hypothetical protein